MPRALRRAAGVAAAASVWFLLTACTAAAMPTPTPTPSETFPPGDGVLRIGTLFPTSGPLEFLEPAQTAAVNAAVRQINAEGGVLGAKVEVVNRDSGDSDKKLEASFEQLVEKGVDVIIGPSSSALAQRLIPLAADVRIPVISPSATFPQLRDADGWFFRTVAGYEHQGAVLGRLLPQQKRPDVALLYSDPDLGGALETTLEAALAENGGELVASERITAGSDADKVVAELAEADPDAVVLATADNGDATKRFITALVSAKLGGDRLWLTSQNLADYSQALPKGTLKGVNGILEGADGDEAFRALVKREDPGVKRYRYAAEAYDATVLAALAAITAGSDSGPAIRASLQAASVGGIKCTSFGECASVLATEPDADYDGISGSLNLDDAGDPVSGSFGIYRYEGDGNTFKRVGSEIG